jgi:hypothetical protein
MTMRSFFFLPALLSALALAGCGGSDEPSFTAPDRKAGDRTPQTAKCDDNDGLRCLLPWPSSTFMAKDASTATGLRLAVDASGMPAPDDTASLALADGFSRVTPLAVGFHAAIDKGTLGKNGETPFRLILAQQDHPKRGEVIPLRLDVVAGEDATDPESLVIAYPLKPLEPNADYVAVVLDDLHAEGGGMLAASHLTKVALGLSNPASQADADFKGYHAPTRALLAEAKIDPAHVLRAWDFTTRSADDATHRLLTMRKAAIDAVDSGKVTVKLTMVDAAPSDPAIAVIVEGTLGGLPSFLEDDSDLSVDAKGEPVQKGTREAPFRVLVPKGEGAYRFITFGHGTGGSYHDDSFDHELASAGLAKVGMQFYGWGEKDVIDTFVSMVRMAEGTHRSSARLMQALADGSGIQRAMSKSLGDTLAAPMLDGTANPATGRKPDASIPVWAGGSLGGTMGLVYAAADPDMHFGVLNVPGAAWTHFIPGSNIFATVRGLLRTSYGGDLDVAHALLMSQSNWDDIDGASYADRTPDEVSDYLIQESIGDPVLPNPGTAMLSVAVGAVQVGAVLDPILGVDTAEAAVGKSGLTQFKVDATDPLDIHGFAARSGPAGDAAREQITTYLASVFAGMPKVVPPKSCPNGNCDFSK